MSVPTIAEEQLLIEFRNKVEPILSSKYQYRNEYLIRWLRARDLNLQKAEEMLKASLAWRKENDVDNALRIELDPFLKEKFLYFADGIDKCSRPVVVIPVGSWDFRKVISSGKTEDFKKFITYMFEHFMMKLRERNKNRGPELFPVTQITAIADWSGYSYMQLVNLKAVQTMLQMASMYEAHYPEILFRCYCINCPSFINILLSIIKPILAPRTMSKIKFYGWNRNEWEVAMREDIDVDQLSFILKRLVQKKS